MASGDDARRALEPLSVKAGSIAVHIDSRAETPRDRSADLEELKATKLIGQRDKLIDAMVTIFKWLNGAVFALTSIAWGFGFWFEHDQIVTERVLMSLIGATVVQAGLAFLTITKFLFPSTAHPADTD